jgi:beta-galactosidase/beta-glucuronidase
MTWQPVPGHIMTRWVKDVTPENAWQEYPRPQMTRPDWLNLNGLWEYAIAPGTQDVAPEFHQQILVPFPIESALSGVKCPLQSDERLWYRRMFSVPPAWFEKRILLHFGAVDWEAKVFVNSRPVGEHVGGYLPFWFDITDVCESGENELVLSVWDPTDTFWQQRGKQVLKPKSIWYTAVSGIWQTVWLEPVPQTFIAGLKITPDVDSGTVSVKVDPAGTQTGAGDVLVRVMKSGTLIAAGETESTEAKISVPIPNPKLWSPDSPDLYDLEITMGEDKVSSYFGMRKFSMKDGRLCLNNQPLFQFGPLDQGYWPDGLYTPPTDEAMRWDIEMVKELGCNMLRKHVKVETARYYYYCDQLGLIVWQDMPNGGKAVGDVTSFLAILFGSRRRDRNYHFAGREDEGSRREYHRELQEMVDHLHNFACIGMWVPFNEGWGQFDAKATTEWLREYDPTRPVDHASGWFDQSGGDCKSLHAYFKKLPIIRPEKRRAMVLSEFGGYSLKVGEHLWNPSAEFGYKKFNDPIALTEAYVHLLENELQPWIDAGLSAAVYTQSADVEIEVNGYVTYDREVEKMNFEEVREAHQKLWKQGI